MSKIELLENLGIELHGRTSGKFKTWCPNCVNVRGKSKKDKDLSVDIDEGLYNCHSASCDFKGKVFENTYKRPEFVNNTNYSDAAVKYMQSRGISTNTMKAMKMTTDYYNIIFNYFERDTCINYKKRGIKEKSFSQFSGAKKMLYNLREIKPKESEDEIREAIIVEGEMDVATWVELGFWSKYEIWSLDQGAGLKGELDGKLECFKNSSKYLEKIDKFYLAGDMDEAGIYTFKEIARRIGEHKCVRVSFSKKDSNAVYMDMLSMGQSKDICYSHFKNLLESAEEYPVQGIIKLDKELRDILLDRYDNGVDKGVRIEGHELSEYWTMLHGETTLISGYPADGKSTFWKNVAMLYAKQHGFKFGCYTPEDNSAEDFYESMCHIFIGKPVDKEYAEKYRFEYANRQEYINAMNFVRRHFFFVHPEADESGYIKLPDNKWINIKMAQLKLSEGIHCIVKDNWAKMEHNIGYNESHYLAQELAKEKFNGNNYMHTFLVAHPTNPSKNKDGSYAEATVFSINGGSQWNNAMDNIIIVRRPNRHIDPSDKLVEVKIAKIRKKRKVGKEGVLEWIYVPKSDSYDSKEYDDKGFPIIKDMRFAYEQMEELPF